MANTLQFCGGAPCIHGATDEHGRPVELRDGRVVRAGAPAPAPAPAPVARPLAAAAPKPAPAPKVAPFIFSPGGPRPAAEALPPVQATSLRAALGHQLQLAGKPGLVDAPAQGDDDSLLAAASRLYGKPLSAPAAVVTAFGLVGGL